MSVISKLSVAFCAFILVSCGRSDKEVSDREHAILDSINKKNNPAPDTVKPEKTAVVLQQTSADKEDTKGVLNYGDIKISYDYDNKLFNKKSDIDGKINNNSGKTYTDFELKVTCLDGNGKVLKSFVHTVRETIRSGKSKKFTIRFTDAPKTESVKISLVKAGEVN